MDSLLLEGAAANGRDSSGRTPLMIAASYNHPYAVEKLLGAGADVHLQDYHGATALHHLFNKQDAPACTECARLLLQAGAAINARDKGGVTPLMRAVLVGRETSEDSSTAIHVLLDRDADFAIPDNRGRTPHAFIIEGDHDSIYFHGAVRERLDALVEQAQMEGATASPMTGSTRSPRL